VALYYNEDIVEEPPETLAEMQTLMDEYHHPADDQYGLSISLTPYHLSGFAQAYGGEMYDGEADELGLTSDAVERGLRVFFEELAPYAVFPNEDNVWFWEGNVAFAISGPWELSTLEDSDIEWGVTTLPALPDGGVMQPYMGVELLFFSKRVLEDPTDGTAARQFAEWYTTNPSRLRRLATDTDSVPVHTELVGDAALPEPIQVFSEQCTRGYPMPANPKMDHVWGPVGDALESVSDDEMALTEALATAEEQIRERWAEDT
jgi:arabinogalactan oligomer/maltooligosaccharide transport system substrate-binding protein